MRTNYLYRSGPTMTWPELNMPEFRKAMHRALGIKKEKPQENETDLRSYKNGKNYCKWADNRMRVIDEAVSKKYVASFGSLSEAIEELPGAYDQIMRNAIRYYFDQLIEKKGGTITSGGRKDGLFYLKDCNINFVGTYEECYRYQIDNLHLIKFTGVNKKLKRIQEKMPDYKFDIKAYSRFVVANIRFRKRLV